MNVRALQLLQLADSAFPTGAFAHSFGLETAVAEGRVHDEPTFAAWLRAYLEHGLGPSDASAIALAMSGTADAGELDDVLFALTTSGESRRALSRMGHALAEAYATLGLARRPGVRHPALHVAAAMQGLGIEPEAAIGAYLSNAVAALGSVAARAVPLGQRSVQRILWDLRPRIAAATAAALQARSAEDLGAWAVEQEIDALRHRLLDARIFAS